MASNLQLLKYLHNNIKEISTDNFILPSSDFDKIIKIENTINELKKKTQDATDSNTESFLDALYFIEKPYSTTPGYYDNVKLIIARATPHIDDVSKAINQNDGDTVYFDINGFKSEINNNILIPVGNNFYTLHEYINNYASVNPNGTVGIRFVGVGAPEVVHYTTINEKIPNNKIVDASLNDIINNPDKYVYDPRTNLNNADYRKFIPITEKGTTTYYQYLYDETLESYKYVTSTTQSAEEAILGQQITDELMSLLQGKEVILAIDYKTLSNSSNEYPLTYEKQYLTDWSNPIVSLKAALESLDSANKGPTYQGFNMWGMDVYKRLLGCIYVYGTIPGMEDMGPQWINVTKYLLYKYHDKGYEIYKNESNPQYDINNNFYSSAFKVWSYDIWKYRNIDLLDSVNNDSIEKQREIQRAIIGFDFESSLSDWTMMIGDCLFMIPPTSIKCITDSSSETIPLLRSTGSAIKQAPQALRYLEFTLFFNDEYGINGVPYTATMPKKDKDGHSIVSHWFDDDGNETDEPIVYYMNGLRALIAMFKLCPFLPITNKYINESLNIEAVALSNLSITTMPGYPSCIAATLQLMEFNYHVYLNEIPFTGDEDTEYLLRANMFEKCIDYETLRFHYQRAIRRGEIAARYAFDSREYLQCTYGNRTALQPMKFGDSTIEFYLPNKDHLDRLLQIKLKAINQPIVTTAETTDDGKEWGKYLGKICAEMNTLSEDLIYKRLQSMIASIGLGTFSAADYRDILQDIAGMFIGDPNDLTDPSIINGINSDDWFDVLPIDKIILDIVARNLRILGINTYVADIKNNKSNGIDIYIHCDTFVLNNDLNKTSFLKNVSTAIGNDVNYSEYYNIKDNTLKLHFSYVRGRNGDILSINLDMTSPGYEFIKYCNDVYNHDKFIGDPADIMQSELSNQKQDIDRDTIDTFHYDLFPDKYLLDTLVVTNISARFANNLSQVQIKMLDGFAPQYFGSQDVMIELSMTTPDEKAAAMINMLPKIVAQYVRDYRLILSAFPLRINTQLTRMMGVNEVSIEACEVSTVPNQVGLYEINISLRSFNRTVRNKEVLTKLDVFNAGAETKNSKNSYTVRNYFNLKDKISEAEIYPDLELPTLEELERYGFRFITYKLDGSKRIYPDPDYYFIYSSLTANKIFRDNIFKELNKTYNSDFSDGKQVGTYDISDNSGALTSIILNGTGTLFEEIKNNELSLSQENIYKRLEAKHKDLYTLAQYVATTIRVDGTLLSQKNINDILKITATYGVKQAWNISSDIKAVFKEKEFKNMNSSQDEELTSEVNNYFNTFRSDLERLIDEISKHTLDYGVLLPSHSAVIDAVESYIKTASVFDSYFGEAINSISDKIAKVVLSYGDAMTGENDYDPTNTSSKKDWQMIPKKTINGKEEFIYLLNDIGQSKASSHSLTEDEILEYSYAFGPFLIRQYLGSELKQFFIDEEFKKLYDNEYYFLDPVIREYQHQLYTHSRSSVIRDKTFMPMGGDSFAEESLRNKTKEIIRSYKIRLMNDHKTNATAIVINVLLVMKALVDHNIFPSVSDYILSTFSGITEEEIEILSDQSKTKTLLYKSKTGEFIQDFGHGAIKEGDLIVRVSPEEEEEILKYNEEIKKLKEEGIELDTKELSKKYESILSVSGKSFDNLLKQNEEYTKKLILGRWVVSCIILMTGFNNSPIYKAISNNEYEQLNSYLLSYQMPLKNTFDKLIYKYIYALIGNRVIKSSEDIAATTYTASEVASAIINESINIGVTKDPFVYTRDSYYDMIMSDKRGRMCRAFPTFYILMVDEGRDIGLWRLNDNFYNTSSIADISITKSRKIAADTCTIVMTNMFKSFTTDDEDGKEMAYDLDTLQNLQYGIADVWDSIFSPRSYFLKEQLLRMQENPIERIQLKPGIRIHVRLGYGSNAYELPTVFNGVIAEVSTGETINIVCQGDGIELTNPILDKIDADDVQNDSKFIGIKQIYNWIQKGATPKTVLVSMLNTKGTFINHLINNITSGRFFNDNVYGIAHFGDPDFIDIFGNGETSQNIYEANPSGIYNGEESMYNSALQSEYKTTEIPKISAHLFEKSYWEIMHLCAGAAVDYICSIIPFGLRSSIFYGLPHFYCAYEYEQVPNVQTEYEKENGIISYRIKERRKPFQQYHMYNSYTDIIGNNIRASSQNIKTCAVGLYTTQGFLGSENVKRLEPMWVDIDIYPEYQKTMTVDTSFLGKGVPILGDLVPFLNGILEWSGISTNNYEVAWRLTAKALKDSVKDMYQGELIVIGDPSVKPYDVMSIWDAYENMTGACEVEAVVHRLSVETGYTTSIYADTLVDIDSRNTQIASMLTAEVATKSLMTYIPIMITSFAFAKNGKPLLSTATHLVQKGLYKTTQSLSNITKFLNLDSELTAKVLSGLDKINYIALSDATFLYKNVAKITSKFKWTDLLGGITNLSDKNKLLTVLLGTTNADNVIQDSTRLANVLKEYAKDNEALIETADIIAEQIENINVNKKNSLYNIIDILKTGDNLSLVEGATDNISEAKKYIQAINKADDITDTSEAVRQLARLVNNIDDAAAIANIDRVADAAKTANQIGDAVVEIAKATDKIDDVADALKGVTVAMRGALSSAIASTIIGFVIELILAILIGGYVKTKLYRWLRNLEVLRVYPLKKNGKVMTAGLEGSRGLVYGSSTFSLQGWLQETIGSITENIHNSGLGQLLIAAFNIAFNGSTALDEEMYSIISNWKRDNGADEEGARSGYYNSKFNTLFSHLIDNPSNDINYYLLKYSNVSRIPALGAQEGTTEANLISDVYNRYRIVDDDSLAFNTRISYLVNLENIKEYTRSHIFYSQNRDIFSYEHEEHPEKLMVLYDNGANHIAVPYHTESGYKDLPFICDELRYILISILNYIANNEQIDYKDFINQKTKKPIQLCIYNALLLDGSSWFNTGYACRFFIKNMEDAKVLEILSKIEKDINIKDNTLFKTKMTSQTSSTGETMFVINVYPAVKDIDAFIYDNTNDTN